MKQVVSTPFTGLLENNEEPEEAKEEEHSESDPLVQDGDQVDKPLTT